MFALCISAWWEPRGHVIRAYCPELGIWATGHTPQEAQAELRERCRQALVGKRDAWEGSLLVPKVPGRVG